MNKPLCWSLMCVSLLFACGERPQQAEEEPLAEAVCNCMKPLAEAYLELQRALEAEDTGRLESLSDHLEAVSDEVDECADRVEAQYGPLSGQREVAVKAAMKERCPDVIKTLNWAEKELVQ